MPSFVTVRRLIHCLLIATAAVLLAAVPAWGQAAPSLIPYTISTFAGGGPTATYATGNLCPVSGLQMTDNLGDGCQASELVLKAPWFITQDKNGNYFFSDSANYAIRRIDASTGIVTLVAGNGAKPTVGTACPSGNIPTTTDGDGCLGTEAYLGRTYGVAISPLTGNLYFTDAANQSVHMIAATNGFITTTGIMSLVAGNPASGKYGYDAGDPTTNTQVVAATTSLLDNPLGLWFDPAGNLYIAEEYKEAVLVVNTSSANTTVTGISIPPGDITKISGAFSSTVPTCVNGTGATGIGCGYTGLATGTTGNGKSAITLPVDAPIAVVTDTTGNVYVNETYDNDLYSVSTAGIFNVYAGVRGSKGSAARGPAATEKIGSQYGLGIDPANNLYIADASYGLVERVDAADQGMYIVAGGGTASFTAGQACPVGFGTATDAAGDGCPATTVKLTSLAGAYGPSSPSTLNAGLILAGLYVDSAGNAMLADTGLNVIHKLASGTAFGNIIGHPTQYIEIHFGVGDGPAASQVLAYTLTTNPTNFMLGSATCSAANSDGTTDCVLPVTAEATAAGPFSSVLKVTSGKGLTSSYTLTGTIVVPVASSTSTTVAGTCPPGAAATITVLVSNSVGLPSGGTVTVYVNGTALTPTYTLPVSRKITLTHVFPTGNTYTVYATYSGDTNDLPSTTLTQTSTTFTSATLVLTAGPYSEASVVAGGTALYTVYVTDYNPPVTTATLASVVCSGLPSGAACIPYPTTPPPSLLSTAFCYDSATIALSVTTTQPNPVVYGFGAYNRNKWTLLFTLPALLLAMVVMVRRRRSPLKFGGVLMALAFLLAMAGSMGCGKDFGGSAPGTPSGTYHFSVTVVDSLGDSQTLGGFTLTVK